MYRSKKIRRTEYNGEWYFSVVDMVEVLTESSVAKRYWTDLKRKLKIEYKRTLNQIKDSKLFSKEELTWYDEPKNNKLLNILYWKFKK